MASEFPATSGEGRIEPAPFLLQPFASRTKNKSSTGLILRRREEKEEEARQRLGVLEAVAKLLDVSILHLRLCPSEGISVMNVVVSGCCVWGNCVEARDGGKTRTHLPVSEHPHTLDYESRVRDEKELSTAYISLLST